MIGTYCIGISNANHCSRVVLIVHLLIFPAVKNNKYTFCYNRYIP